jgi:soluble lytic murein transglycosylase-like protein
MCAIFNAPTQSPTALARKGEDTMNTQANLVLRGAFLGSLLVCVLCCILTAGNTSINSPSKARAAAEVKTKVKTQPNPPCRLSNKYPQEILQWCDLITAKAEQTSLAPDLIAALIWQESGGDPLAYSKSGAVGLMQVMPRDGIAANFTCANGPCFASRPTIEELQNPEYNLEYGTGMLAGLVKHTGSLREALKAYGPMDVGYYYADKVLGIYKQYGK